MNEIAKSVAKEATQQPAAMSGDTKALLAFESAKKSVGVSYALWFFFGWLGAHRFYLGRTGSGIAMLIIFVISTILSVVGVGLLGFVALGIWAIVDAFLIPGLAREYNQALITRIESGLGA